MEAIMVKKKAEEREILTREGEVTDWRAEVWVHSFSVDPDVDFDQDQKKRVERNALPSITVRGAFSQDVKGVSKFDIVVVPGKPIVGKAEIPCVGVILKAKPVIEAHITLSEMEYQTVLALATTGNLRYFSCHFQEPRYGRSLITSLTFGSHKPEES
jgi:hypothetical protein